MAEPLANRFQNASVKNMMTGRRNIAPRMILKTLSKRKEKPRKQQKAPHIN